MLSIGASIIKSQMDTIALQKHNISMQEEQGVKIKELRRQRELINPTGWKDDGSCCRAGMRAKMVQELSQAHLKGIMTPSEYAVIARRLFSKPSSELLTEMDAPAPMRGRSGTDSRIQTDRYRWIFGARKAKAKGSEHATASPIPIRPAPSQKRGVAGLQAEQQSASLPNEGLKTLSTEFLRQQEEQYPLMKLYPPYMQEALRELFATELYQSLPESDVPLSARAQPETDTARPFQEVPGTSSPLSSGALPGTRSSDAPSPRPAADGGGPLQSQPLSVTQRDSDLQTEFDTFAQARLHMQRVSDLQAESGTRARATFHLQHAPGLPTESGTREQAASDVVQYTRL